MKNLSGMYEIILRLSESRQTLLINLERERAEHAAAMLRREDKHKEEIANTQQTLSQPSAEPPPSELLIKELIDNLNEHSQKVSECKEHTLALTDQLKQLHQGTISTKFYNNDEATYASITAKTVTSKIKPVHSIIITSEDEKDTSADVVNKIRTAVDAISSGIRVDKLRKAKDQKVIISCHTKEDLARVADKLKTSQAKLKVDKAVNKDPLIIAMDVLEYNKDEDIVKAIKNQNSHILGNIPEEEIRVAVRYRRKARNPHENHVVLQVSPMVWKRLTDAGRVHLGLQRVRVYDQSPLIQCSRCLRFGHGRRLCTEAVDLCSHCGGPHLRAACPAWLVNDKPTCKNCCVANYDKTDHNAFDRECPVRKRWDSLARSTIAYC